MARPICQALVEIAGNQSASAYPASMEIRAFRAPSVSRGVNHDWRNWNNFFRISGTALILPLSAQPEAPLPDALKPPPPAQPIDRGKTPER